MADKKISELTNVTAIALFNEFPIVNSSETKNMTVQQIMNVILNGDISVDVPLGSLEINAAGEAFLYNGLTLTGGSLLVSGGSIVCDDNAITSGLGLFAGSPTYDGRLELTDVGDNIDVGLYAEVNKTNWINNWLVVNGLYYGKTAPCPFYVEGEISATALASLSSNTLTLLRNDNSTTYGVDTYLIGGTEGAHSINFGTATDINLGRLSYDIFFETMAFRVGNENRMTLNPDDGLTLYDGSNNEFLQFYLDTNDPTIAFFDISGGNRLNLYLLASSSDDRIVFNGQTASANTKVEILAPSGKTAFMSVRVIGLDEVQHRADSSGGYTLENQNTDGDIDIVVNPSGVPETAIMVDGGTADIQIADGRVTVRKDTLGHGELTIYDDNGSSVLSLVHTDADSTEFKLQNTDLGSAPQYADDIAFIMQSVNTGTGSFGAVTVGIKDIIAASCETGSIKRYSVNNNVFISRTQLNGGVEGYTVYGSDVSPQALMHVQKNTAGEFVGYFYNVGSATNYGLHIRAGSTTDGTLVQFSDQDTVNIGAITHSSGTVTYGAFTGWHPCILKEEDKSKMFDYALVQIDSISDKSNKANIIYNVSLCSTPDSARALGVMSAKRKKVTSAIKQLENEIERFETKKIRKETYNENNKNTQYLSRLDSIYNTRKQKIEEKINIELTKYNEYKEDPKVISNPLLYDMVNDKIQKLNTQLEKANEKIEIHKNTIIEKIEKQLLKNETDLVRIYEQIAKKQNQIIEYQEADYEYLEVFCLGNGVCWVNNEGGNIEFSDSKKTYFTSSSELGICKAQNIDYPNDKTLGYITENVNWENEQDNRKLVSCIYTAG